MTQSNNFEFSGPLYEQVYNLLRSRILAGEWQPRALVPGEVILSTELGVSVGTVRKAMDQLARENLVVRARGRGTFVKDDAQWHSAAGVRVLDRSGRVLLPSIRVVNASLTQALPGEIDLLQIAADPAGTPMVHRIERQWFSGQDVLVREAIVVDATRFPNLSVRSPDAEADTLHLVYARHFRTQVERIVWEIGDRIIGNIADKADKTRSAMSASVARLNRLAFDARYLPVELSQFEIQLENCLVQLSE